MSLPTVSAIIPALNERDNLPHVLPHVPAQVTEVILVDGHSTDGTVQAAKELMPSIRVVHQEGRGKGNALRSGFHAATGDIIVMLDADGSTDPREIPRFVHALLAGADFAKGSRFLHGGGTSDMPFHRRWGNGNFVRMVRLLYGGQFTDLCYGYNAFWRRVLPVLDLDGDGFEIETMMNIRALRAGLRIVEVPSFEDRRVIGEGRLRTIPDGWRVLRTIFSERSRPVADWSRPEPDHGQPWSMMVPIPIEAVHTNGSGHVNGSGQVNGNGHELGVARSWLDRDGHPASTHALSYIAEHTSASEYRAVAANGNGNGDARSWQNVVDGYVERLGQLMAAADRTAISRVVDELRAARDRGATVFIAGNGGSSATAAHWVNDLGKAAKASGRPPMRVMNLSDNVPWLTALGNDEGYERVFAGQLENFARPDDVLVVVTASGNSPNILAALELARSIGMRTLGLVGFDGGHALGMLDEAVWIRTEPRAYGLVETAHSAVADIVTTCLINDHAVVGTAEAAIATAD